MKTMNFTTVCIAEPAVHFLSPTPQAHDKMSKMKSFIVKISTSLFILGAVLSANTKSMAAVLACKPVDSVLTQRYPEKPNDISPLLIGEFVPVVKIPAADGKMFDLNARVAEKPTILVFYRGGWCPFCNKELAGLQSIQSDLVNLGYQIIAISTDSPENLNKSVDKHQLTYTLLSDADLAVSKQFGIAFKAPMAYDKTITEGSGGKNADKLLPVPSVFILDKTGTIQFEYISPDFRQRISPGLLKAAAVALKNGNNSSKQ